MIELKIMPLQPEVLRLGTACAMILSCFACFTEVQAEGYRHHRYTIPYRYDFLDDGRDLRQDVYRLREQLKRQQRQLETQTRLQQEQIRLLRQQASARKQITAMQACHYSFSAGLQLCGDLFGTASADYARCHKKVLEHNPGCADEGAEPGAGD